MVSPDTSLWSVYLETGDPHTPTREFWRAHVCDFVSLLEEPNLAHEWGGMEYHLSEAGMDPSLFVAASRLADIDATATRRLRSRWTAEAKKDAGKDLPHRLADLLSEVCGFLFWREPGLVSDLAGGPAAV